MVKLSLYMLLAVLLTTVAATAAEAPLAERPFAEGSSKRASIIGLLPEIDDMECPFRFNFTRCWVSIAKVDGCVSDLFKSITSFKASVSADCCKAITNVSGMCFSVFGGLFASVLRDHCIAKFPNVPMAEGPGSSALGEERM